MAYRSQQQIELNSIVGEIQKNSWFWHKNFTEQESDEIIMEILASIDDVMKIHGKQLSNPDIKRNEPADRRISEAVVKSLDTVLNCAISYMPPNAGGKKRDMIILELRFDQPDDSHIELYGDLKWSLGAYNPRNCKVRFGY